MAMDKVTEGYGNLITVTILFCMFAFMDECCYLSILVLFLQLHTHTEKNGVKCDHNYSQFSQ